MTHGAGRVERSVDDKSLACMGKLFAGGFPRTPRNGGVADRVTYPLRGTSLPDAEAVHPITLPCSPAVSDQRQARFEDTVRLRAQQIPIKALIVFSIHSCLPSRSADNGWVT